MDKYMENINIDNTKLNLFLNFTLVFDECEHWEESQRNQQLSDMDFYMKESLFGDYFMT